MSDIAAELAEASERYKKAKAKAVKYAPELLRRLCRTMSLREVGRRINRSPTYLSQISKGTIECSDGTYFAMATLCRMVESESQDT